MQLNANNASHPYPPCSHPFNISPPMPPNHSHHLHELGRYIHPVLHLSIPASKQFAQIPTSLFVFVPFISFLVESYHPVLSSSKFRSKELDSYQAIIIRVAKATETRHQLKSFINPHLPPRLEQVFFSHFFSSVVCVSSC